MSSLDFSIRSLTELPDMVILEILVKLPIKYVMVCRCVCKSLYNLTFDPFFTRSYFSNPPFTVVVCIYEQPGHTREFYLLEIGRNCDDVIRTPFHPKALTFNTDGTLYEFGSCNGLVCLVQVIYLDDCIDDSFWVEETVYIVNPLLGEITRLPKIEFHYYDYDIYSDDVVYYFGCTREANRYKVLRFATTGEYDVIWHGEVFTIGVDDEWRSLDGISFPFILECNDSSDVCFNGVIHSLMNNRSFIFCFEVEEEREKQISLPPGIRKERSSKFSLIVFNDKLCYTENNCDSGIDIWVMKEYGVGESWSKEIILRSWIPFELQPLPQIFSASKDGDLLMRTTKRCYPNTNKTGYPNTILSLDPRAKVCRKYEVHVGEIDPYVPRFFS